MVCVSSVAAYELLRPTDMFLNALFLLCICFLPGGEHLTATLDAQSFFICIIEFLHEL